MTKILIVEDDKDIASLMKRALLADRHMVDLIHDGNEAAGRLKAYSYDLLILDWELPGISGIEICKQYRSSGGTAPVLFTTARSRIDDKEAGFDTGADDYLCKPFMVRELILRVNALLRRPVALAEEKLAAGNLVMEPRKQKAVYSGREVNLSPREFALLEFLLRHCQQVFTPEALLSRVWENDSEATADVVRTTIKQIRRKLGESSDDSIIKNIHGVGYKVES